jgi:flagellar hook-associated protein 3 FlgL
MNNITYGDAAQSKQLQRFSTALKKNMAQLSIEVTTGQTANTQRRLGGDYSQLAPLERAISSVAIFQRNSKTLEMQYDAAQSAFERATSGTVEGAARLLQAGSLGDNIGIRTSALQARAQLDQAVAAFNTVIGGRAVFAGEDTNGTALASSDTIISSIMTEIAGQTSVYAIRTTISNWFHAAGGGFDATGYLGGDPQRSSVSVASNISVQQSTTAANVEIRGLLEGLLLGAILAEPTLELDVDSRAKLAVSAGERLINAETSMTRLAGNLGLLQERVAFSSSQNSAELSSLNIARSSMLEVDQYTAASQLEDTIAQLDAIYALTARMSRLSLSEYL